MEDAIGEISIAS